MNGRAKRIALFSLPGIALLTFSAMASVRRVPNINVHDCKSDIRMGNEAVSRKPNVDGPGMHFVRGAWRFRTGESVWYNPWQSIQAICKEVNHCE